MGGADYTFKVEQPPTAAGTRPETSELIANMWRAVDDHPGEWVRIASYATKESAGTIASNLRTNRRTKNRPPGRWEFRSGPIEGEDRFGVWAKYLGPEEGSELAVRTT